MTGRDGWGIGTESPQGRCAGSNSQGGSHSRGEYEMTLVAIVDFSV